MLSCKSVDYVIKQAEQQKLVLVGLNKYKNTLKNIFSPQSFKKLKRIYKNLIKTKLYHVYTKLLLIKRILLKIDFKISKLIIHGKI